MYVVIFFVLPHSGSKNRLFGRKKKKNCVVSTVRAVFECERVQIISCNANPFAPGSSQGDSSYYGYCMLSVSVSSVCNSPGESVCVDTVYTHDVYVFDGKPVGALQAGW